MISIAITDDHLMVLEGLKTMLNQNEEYSIMNTYSSVLDMIEGLAIKQPDVLLLDINLPDGNGVVACKNIHKIYPNIAIVGLTNYEETSFIKQMIQNGAKGYLLKNTGREELFKAINTVVKGELYLPEKLKNLMLGESFGKPVNSFIPKITKREKEVLLLIAEELTTEEIANKLFISTKTVEAHRSNLIQKIGARNSAGLIKKSIEKGLI